MTETAIQHGIYKIPTRQPVVKQLSYIIHCSARKSILIAKGVTAYLLNLHYAESYLQKRGSQCIGHTYHDNLMSQLFIQSEA